MNAQEIVTELEGLGGRIEVRGDRLHIQVPPGTATPELKARLIDHKPDLLRLLQPKLCFHCAGLNRCDCISCSPGLAIAGGDFTVKSGPCVACLRTAKR